MHDAHDYVFLAVPLVEVLQSFLSLAKEEI